MLEKIYKLFRINTLKGRLRFSFIILLLLFVVLCYIPFAKYAKEFREVEARNNLEQSINLQQLIIDRWFEEKNKTILTISQLPVVKEGNKDKIKEALEMFENNHPEFDGITFVNTIGVTEIDSDGLAGIDLSDRIYFHEAKKGKSYVTDFLIGRQSHQPIIIFSSPVYNYNQQFQGLVFGSVRLNTINDVMKKFRLNETGQTYLVNREGQLITSLRFPSNTLQKGSKDGFSEKVSSEILDSALEGKEITQGYDDYRGIPVFGTYRWVNDNKWLIIGEISEDEIFSPFYRLSKTFSGVLLIFILTGLLVTFLISNRIERIFHHVLDGAKAIGRTKYSYRIIPSQYVNYSIELQDLCKTFNEMAEMIQYQMHSIQVSEERYRALIETSPNSIVVHQKDKIVYANPNCVRLLKASSIEDLLGRNIIEFVHPDYHNVVLDRMEKLNNRQAVGLLEEKYVLLDGSTINVEVIATPIEYMGQSAFQVIIQDISIRKEMENELRKSQEQFRLLAEYSSDMITLHDKDGKYLYTSPACREILGYEENEIIGHDAFLYIHPSDHELVRQNHQTLLDSGYSISTYRIRRKDGEYVWFESANRLLQGTHTEDPKLIVVSRNINKRKLAEEKLKEANELLQRLSSIDGLTGVSNRRTFDERLENEWRRSLRNSTPLSLIMFDIDYFKAYNDTYGHQGGDGCLKQLAAVVEVTLNRSSDLLCRYGGEEFGVILPDTDEAGAYIVGEKIRKAVEATKIPHAGSTISKWVTVSIGTATIVPTSNMEPAMLIANADKAVYEAKKVGRNCVRTYKK